MNLADSPEELLDVVNERDEVVMVLPKKKIHANPMLIHREIRVYLFDEKNRLLLQQRSKHKKVNPLAWSESCAGHVCAGESYENTAHRELQEELGVDVELDYLGKVLIKSDTESRFTAIYKGTISSKTVFSLQQTEVQQVAFMTRQQVDELINSGEKLGKFFIDTLDVIWGKQNCQDLSVECFDTPGLGLQNQSRKPSTS